MKRKMRGLRGWMAALLALMLTVLPLDARAEENADGTKYYLGSAVNAGRDTGYAEEKTIGEGDPHFGWSLGEFFVSGYTRVTEDAAGDPVFLKNLGDTVTLWFRLDQDITCLNGSADLSIQADTDGYDAWFGVEKTDFGRGALIIRHTDYQNHTGDPVIYTDYLAADAAAGAEVQVELFEEGDYEVALNYQVKKAGKELFGLDPFSTCSDYRIFFRFSVRNGNCMIYPFDTATGSELTNTAVTENGFSLDLAKSRYLDIDIRKEVLNEGADGLTEDVRFNAPAQDGAQFTEEGIYTITVSNRYTGQQTQKKIYVGTNDLLKAHVTTGLAIPEIAVQLSNGASVAADGSLIPASETAPEEQTQPAPIPQAGEEKGGLPWYVIVALVIGVPVAGFFIVVEFRKRDRYSRWYRK